MAISIVYIFDGLDSFGIARDIVTVRFNNETDTYSVTAKDATTGATVVPQLSYNGQDPSYEDIEITRVCGVGAYEGDQFVIYGSSEQPFAYTQSVIGLG